jgi:enoyl-CoA hydratase/carnithine racemase
VRAALIVAYSRGEMSKHAQFTRLHVKTLAPHVLSCELNRPDRLNAFDEAMWSE